MGQNRSNSNEQPIFDTTEWIQAVEDVDNCRFPNVNPYRRRLLMNKRTTQLVEEYEIHFFNQEDYNVFIKDYQARKEVASQSGGAMQGKKGSQLIYLVRYFRNLTIHELCASVYSGMLYIDKVDLRLKQVNDIPFEDEIYLYQSCLSGFKILYQQFGAFEVTQQMIFFDQQGQVKLWINQNLSKFIPNFQPQFYNTLTYTQSKCSQSQMLKNLINIIDHNSDQQSIPRSQSFKQYLKQFNILDKLSFSKAIQFFETYLAQYHIVKPKRMESIYQLFNNDDVRSQDGSQVVMHFRRSENGSAKEIKKIDNQGNGTRNYRDNRDSMQMEQSQASNNSKKGWEKMINRKESRQKQQINNWRPNQSRHSSNRQSQANIFEAKPYGQVDPKPKINNTPNIPTLNPHPNQPPRINRTITFQISPRIPHNPPPIARYQSLDKSQSSLLRSAHHNVVFKYDQRQIVTPVKMVASTNQLVASNKQLGPSVSIPAPNYQIANPKIIMPFRMLNSPRNGHEINYKNTIISQNEQTRISLNGNNRQTQILISGDKRQVTVPNDNKLDVHSLLNLERRQETSSLSNEKTSKQTTARLNYYTSDSEYTLDKQIAEDMMKYLNFSLDPKQV